MATRCSEYISNQIKEEIWRRMLMLVRSKFIETRSRIEEDHSMDPTPFQHWEQNLAGVY